ncbi:hypothetical protein IV53_GL001047 [Ligilactobacillus ceti DSM 22408]|uniref:Dithiol-disulfide isomerase n=1 Tax=Ligilactobacillus ceti DSM 22408 TaxID=1122146 RepID=A0A0R2KI72_9LACO|nr:hypothetical protein IV53_GL001047 [Ligilactobacillus ceti DSM 22408]
MDRESLSKNDLNLRNTLSREVYRASLDYKAALFQGQKRGRLFLLNVQDQIKNNAQYHYTEEIAQQAAIAARLDLELFNEDCNSELAIKAFKQDQKLAAEMKVTQHPSVVIFDPSNEKTAFSISGPDSMTFLDNVLTTQFCNHGETNVVAEKKALEQIQYSKKNSSHPLRLR